MEELAIIGNNALQPQISAFSADLFRRFIEYTDREPTTMKGYVTCLRQFVKWMKNTGTTSPQRADIIAYKEYLNGATFGRSGTETLKAGTKQQYLRAVKHFFKWTAAEGLYPNVADNIHGAKVRTDTHKKDALDREAVKIIADSIDRSTEKGKRLYAMYLLCISCGLRTIEINRANVEDIKEFYEQNRKQAKDVMLMAAVSCFCGICFHRDARRSARRRWETDCPCGSDGWNRRTVHP